MQQLFHWARMTLTAFAVVGLSPGVQASMGDRQPVESLAPAGDDASLQVLHRGANSGHVLTRIDAVQRLATEADPASLQVLIDALQDDDAQIRQLAAIGLANIGHEDSIPALAEAMGDDNARVRSQAGAAIVRIGVSAEGLQSILEAAEGSAEPGSQRGNRVGKRGARLQGKPNPTAGLEPITAGQESLVISKKVLRMLAVSDPGLRQDLLAALSDRGRQKRYLAAYALSVSEDPAVARAFEKALDEQDTVVISGAYEYFLRHHEGAAKGGLMRGIVEFADPDLVLAMSRTSDEELQNAAREMAGRKGIRLDD